MKINFFLQSKDFGGAEKFAYDLVLELAKENIAINFYTSNEFLLRDLSNKKNIYVERIPVYLDFAGNRKGLLKSFLLLPIAKIYYLKTLLKIKKDHDKQAIICSGFSEKVVLAPLAKLIDLPVYFIEYGPLDPIFKKFFGLPKFLYYLSKNWTQKIIVPSKNTAKSLKKIFKQEQMVFIPCGSPLPQINRKTAIKKGQVAVVSRLEKGKGQDLAIKAFKIVKKKIKDVELLIIGRGDKTYKQELEKLSNKDPQIKFLDYVQDKQKIIEESEIVLCPSVWPLEGFGLTIIEAMALSKPIIAFDRAPGNELVSAQSALLAKNGDYYDLAKQIIKLLKDEKLQQKLSNAAYQDFLAKYQIKEIAKQYLTLLQN